MDNKSNWFELNWKENYFDFVRRQSSADSIYWYHANETTSNVVTVGECVEKTYSMLDEAFCEMSNSNWVIGSGETEMEIFADFFLRRKFIFVELIQSNKKYIQTISQLSTECLYLKWIIDEELYRLLSVSLFHHALQCLFFDCWILFLSHARSSNSCSDLCSVDGEHVNQPVRFTVLPYLYDSYSWCVLCAVRVWVCVNVDVFISLPVECWMLCVVCLLVRFWVVSEEFIDRFPRFVQKCRKNIGEKKKWMERSKEEAKHLICYRLLSSVFYRKIWK